MIQNTKTYLEYLKQKRYLKALGIKNELGKKEILDVGCNNGYGCTVLNAIGIDINHKLLIVAKKSKRSEVIECDAHFLPFRFMTFNMVTCFEIIEHVRKPKKVLGEIFQILNPEGLILLTTPNKNFLRIARILVGKKKPSFHVKEYSYKEMATMMKDAGFIELELKGLGTWVPDFLIQRFPKLSDYLGRVGLNYTFLCIAKK